MLPRDPRTKQKELKTYQALELGRTFKSAAQRRRAAARGVYRVIGGDDVSRPYLKVTSVRYRQVRATVAEEWFREARSLSLSSEALWELGATRIENETYRRLAAENLQTQRIENTMLERQGRRLTAHEKTLFGEALADEDRKGPAVTARDTALEDVLAAVRRRRRDAGERLRTAWLEAVGGDIARQTELVKIDADAGIAYYRCLQPVLAHQLQRDPEVPRRLSAALGVTLRQLRKSTR